MPKLEDTRRENLKRNAEIFEAFGLEEMKANLQIKKRMSEVYSPAVKRSSTTKQKPVRRSLRLKDVPPIEYNAEVVLGNETIETEEIVRKPSGPMTLSQCLEDAGETASEDYLAGKVFNNVKSTFDIHTQSSESLAGFVERLKNLRMDPSCFARLTPLRSTSLTIHPAAEKALIISGGRHGSLGIWDATNRENPPVVLEPHTIVVSKIDVHPEKPQSIITSSYDGFVRLTDLEKRMVEEVYCSPDAKDVTSMDLVDCDTIIMGQTNAFATTIDLRNKKGASIGHKYYCGIGGRNCTVKSITVHPRRKELFATSTNAGHVLLWDRRYNSKWVSFLPHIRTVQWCEFSPVNGNFLLTSSSCNQIRIYDTATISSGKLKEEDARPKVMISHNNNTGRYVTPFRPRWLPQREDCLVVGSMSYPRQAEIFNTITGKKIASLTSDVLTSIHSLWAYHPALNILAGSNSSGRVCVFIP